ncbi:glycosyltransferase family 4 protein [Alteromonas sp. R78001]|uniref:glycosyltransferase family 4 protein n=1 Tax=Alteromonas sp. R78001 TaxID=3093865 RepID=UPI00366CE645
MNNSNFVAIVQSGLFDREWYLRKYKDVAIIGMEPIEHYLKYGVILNRDPSPLFSTSKYLDENREIKASKINPLLHYISKKNTFSPYVKEMQCKRNSEDILQVSGSHLEPLKVVFHSHNLKWQGAPNSLFEIAKGINNSVDYSSLVFCSSVGPLAEAYTDNNVSVKIEPFPSRGIPDEPEKYESYISQLASSYVAVKAKIVHANTLQAYFSVLAAQHANIPVLWNIRESEEPLSYFEYLPSYLRERAFNAIGTANKVVFVAKATMDLWLKYFDGKNFELITNGVDVSRLHLSAYGVEKYQAKLSFGICPKECVLLSVGTVSERKNQQELIDAYKLALASGLENCVLLIVGMNSSDYASSLKESVTELGQMGGRVILVDETNSMSGLSTIASAYSAADIFSINSLVESYPRVVVEAFSFGLPVLASKCFGTVEQINHQINGFLYEQGDLTSLATFMEKLVNDEGLRSKMSKEAFKRTTQLNTYQVMINSYIKIYDELANA